MGDGWYVRKGSAGQETARAKAQVILRKVPSPQSSLLIPQSRAGKGGCVRKWPGLNRRLEYPEYQARKLGASFCREGSSRGRMQSKDVKPWSQRSRRVLIN